MRQDDDIERHAGALGAVDPPDDTAKLRLADQFLRGQRPYGDDQARPQEMNLAIEVPRAVRDLGRTRHAIAASLRIAPGETANDSAHVDGFAERGFIDAEALEPTEETPPRGVREWAFVLHFVRAGRLS